MTPANVLVVLIGAGLLAVAAWGWAGRSPRARWWVGRPLGAQLVLAVVPGLGLIAISTGALTLAGTAAAPLVALPFIVGALLELAGIFSLLPGWWAPAWYRRLPPGQRAGGASRSAIAAAMAGYLGRPGVISASEAAARLGPARPIASWRGGWVYDADTDQRPHAMSRKGTVEGRLTLYPTAVVFTASRVEDVLRGESTVVLVPTADITGVQVVPPRAGADGQPRSGWLHRSWFPRLVIRAGDQVHVFEVGLGRSGQVARRVAAIAREVR